MISKKVFLKDLDCYKNATEIQKKNKLFSPNRVFDLNRYPNEKIKKEMEQFVYFRGSKLTPLSIRSDIYLFNQLGAFLTEECNDIESFADIDLEVLERKCRAWMMKNGKSYIHKKKKTETGNEVYVRSEVFGYMKKVKEFICPVKDVFSFEEDTWNLETIPLQVRQNPVKIIKTISFRKIMQEEIKKEVKMAIFQHLSQKALGTILMEMSAINFFSDFLYKNYPKINSFYEVNREVIEDYLYFLNLEANRKKSYEKEVIHLKCLLCSIGQIMEIKHLQSLFLLDDVGKAPQILYKVYSDAEIRRLNAAILQEDKQVARALILHQLLGTRISEILTLKRDSLLWKDEKKWLIRITQIKSQKLYYKPVNEEIKNLFEKACEYTKTNYGDCEYVFVDEKNPWRPMQYGKIQYCLMAMIQKKDLRDDNGELFSVGTHIWRHCYGKRLTQLHIDDATIAKLMGHSNTSSLKNYRRIGNKQLANETRKTRKNMDAVLREAMKEW